MVALILDWQAIRSVLDTAATRIGIRVPVSQLPSEDATANVLANLPIQPRLDRTLSFGARQLLLQHRGLWDLLEVRKDARSER